MGMPASDSSSSQPLKPMHNAANPTHGQRTAPSIQPSFKPTGQPHSKTPAATRYIQVMTGSPRREHRARRRC